MIPTMYVIQQIAKEIECLVVQDSVYDVKLEKTFSKMTEDEKRLMIERVSEKEIQTRIDLVDLQAFELKDKLQEKLKKSREEAEERKKEIEQLQSKVDRSCLTQNNTRIRSFFFSRQVTEGVLVMEGEEEVLKGTKTKYFELFPERNYKQGRSIRNILDEFYQSIILRQVQQLKYIFVQLNLNSTVY